MGVIRFVQDGSEKIAYMQISKQLLMSSARSSWGRREGIYRVNKNSAVVGRDILS